MRKLSSYLIRTYFGSNLGFRVRLFNVLALAGATVSLMVGLINLFSGHKPMVILIDLAGAVLSFALMIFASKSGRYQLCYMITIIAIFLGLFPYLFFSMGGYHGGIPTFFVFAVVFTVFMLEGKSAVIVPVLELFLYSGLFLYAYWNPAAVNPFPEESGYLISSLMDMLICAIALGLTMLLQIRIYRRQQKKLDEQNDMLAQISRSKSELLGNISHEVKTPLTVISTEIQTAGEILKDPEPGEDEAIRIRLQNAQREVMRLSRLVGGTLSLASMSENTAQEMLNIDDLLHNIADTWRELLGKRENLLATDIDDDLPPIFGSGDLLIQVMSNLVHNANSHTTNGTIRIRAKHTGSMVTVSVEDTGTGIISTLLPNIFDRGVSGQGGTGYGLYLCKTIIEAHSGEIWAESTLGHGTIITFTIPVYAGQYVG